MLTTFTPPTILLQRIRFMDVRMEMIPNWIVEENLSDKKYFMVHIFTTHLQYQRSFGYFRHETFFWFCYFWFEWKWYQKVWRITVGLKWFSFIVNFGLQWELNFPIRGFNIWSNNAIFQCWFSNFKVVFICDVQMNGHWFFIIWYLNTKTSWLWH